MSDQAPTPPLNAVPSLVRWRDAPRLYNGATLAYGSLRVTSNGSRTVIFVGVGVSPETALQDGELNLASSARTIWLVNEFEGPDGYDTDVFSVLAERRALRDRVSPEERERQLQALEISKAYIDELMDAARAERDVSEMLTVIDNDFARGNLGLRKVAREWVAAGLTPEEAEAWIEEGHCFTAAGASECKRAGMTPAEAGRRHPRLRCTWGYAICNADATPQEFCSHVEDTE